MTTSGRIDIEVARSESHARQTFEVEVDPAWSLAQLVGVLQSNYDDSIAFQIYCGTGQCGLCMVRANGVEVRSCDTPIEALAIYSRNRERRRLKLEPLEDLPCLRDLIVDYSSRVAQLVTVGHSGTFDMNISRAVRRAVTAGWSMAAADVDWP